MSDENPEIQDTNIFSAEEKKQAIDTIKSDIKNEIFAWIKKWGRIILTIAGVLALIGFSISLRQMYNYISSSIATKFAEPNIKATLTTVAENQAKQIIKNEITPEITKIRQDIEKEYNEFSVEIEKMRSEIALFKSYLEDSRARFSDEYNTLATEVTTLKERNKLVKLADMAIAEGNRNAFNELENFKDKPTYSELLPVVNAEIFRIKSFYLTGTRIKGVSITYKGPEGIELVDDKIPTNILISNLKHTDWRIRTKAAELLKTRKEKGVPEALLEAACDDERLDVLKISLEGFERVTGFESNDVFDYKPAVKWWHENQQKVTETLKEQESIE